MIVTYFWSEDSFAVNFVNDIEPKIVRKRKFKDAVWLQRESQSNSDLDNICSSYFADIFAIQISLRVKLSILKWLRLSRQCYQIQPLTHLVNHKCLRVSCDKLEAFHLVLINGVLEFGEF